MLTAQRQYIALFEAQVNPFLYTTPWWLDVTCQHGTWEAVFLNKKLSDHPTAIPLYATRIRGLSALTTPPATQWVNALSNGNEEISLDANRLLGIPKTSILDFSIKNISSGTNSSTPFTTTTRYSYILPYSANFDEMISGYNEGLRRNLKQAESRFVIRAVDDINTFVALCESPYIQKKQKPLWWIRAMLPDLVRELLQRDRGRMLFVFEQDLPVASMLTGWDGHTDYYIAGGRIGTDAGSSAHSLLLHQAVRDAHARANAFDFEGSMLPGIANFFQSFGAKPIPYYQIRRYMGLGKIWALSK